MQETGITGGLGALRRAGITPTRAAALLGIALGVGVTVLAVGAGWALRENAIAGWKDEMRNYSLVLAAHADQSLGAAALVLDTVTERVQSQRPGDSAALRQLAGREPVHQMLRDSMSGSPQVNIVAIVDAEGNLAATSRSHPVRAAIFTDRDYFSAQRDNPKSGMHVSAPVKNRFNGEWTFFLSRRIEGRDGRFAGLVLVGISSDYFRNFYENVRLRPGSTLALFRPRLRAARAHAGRGEGDGDELPERRRGTHRRDARAAAGRRGHREAARIEPGGTPLAACSRCACRTGIHSSPR